MFVFLSSYIIVFVCQDAYIRNKSWAELNESKPVESDKNKEIHYGNHLSSEEIGSMTLALRHPLLGPSRNVRRYYYLP